MVRQGAGADPGRGGRPLPRSPPSACFFNNPRFAVFNIIDFDRVDTLQWATQLLVQVALVVKYVVVDGDVVFSILYKT